MVHCCAESVYNLGDRAENIVLSEFVVLCLKYLFFRNNNILEIRVLQTDYSHYYGGPQGPSLIRK